MHVMDSKTSSGSKCIIETKKAKEEFSGITEHENKRVQQVVDKENERILQTSQRNGAPVTMCPICLEEIPAIRSLEEKKKGRGHMLMMCCNVRHCNSCVDKSIEYMDKGNSKCYNCREPAHSRTYWAKSIKPDDQRHWILLVIGRDYMRGENGLKQDIKKGLKLLKRAAELGDADAQNILADAYCHGTSFLPTCSEKGRYYAEKAADQGAEVSQTILAKMIMDSPDYNDAKGDEKAYKLLTLASYQGCHNGRLCLGSSYLMRRSMFKQGEEDWKKNALLSLYWFGKAGEVQNRDPRGCISLTMMTHQLDVAMRTLWYPRHDSNRDPLPGYSHVPFNIWANAKGGQYTKEYYMWPNPWKSKCANCNKASQEDEQFKACARCKAFHYCSKKCQVEHWKDGHKVDCKGHWIEEFFPDLRMAVAKNKF